MYFKGVGFGRLERVLAPEQRSLCETEGNGRLYLSEVRTVCRRLANGLWLRCSEIRASNALSSCAACIEMFL
jgi:hypothetical protein